MFRRGIPAILLAIACSPAAAQDLLPPGVLLLSRVKRHVREEFGHLPDYTCLETIQRYRSGAAGKGGLKPLDTVRVEVLFTGTQELFALPGARNFRDDNLARYAREGMSATGAFALDLKTVFVQDNATSQYRGDEEADGRRAVRYDYRVPLLSSGFNVYLPEGSARVATRGSFWIDPESLDVLRLESHADDIPPTFPLAESASIVRYAPTRIGERTVMLPETSELSLRKTDGELSRNVLQFTHCRSFHTESSISFGATGLPSPDGPATGLPPSEEIEEPLPAGLTIALGMTSPLSQEDSVGFQIEARVLASVTSKGKVVVREGSVVRGRIRSLKKSPEAPGYWVVALEFMEVEADGQLRRFYADLQELDSSAGVTRSVGGLPGTLQLSLVDLPGIGAFFVRGERFALPAGFRTVWKTK